MNKHKSHIIGAIEEGSIAEELGIEPGDELISINGEKITDLEYTISDNDFLDNTYIIIRRGKKNYYIGVKEV